MTQPNPAREPGSLDNGRTKLIDAREYALIITIDLNGVADVQSSRIDRAQAANYLRMLADAFSERLPVVSLPQETEQ